MAEHSMCQPGPARPPGALPRRLARLRALPEGEVARVPLDRRRLDPGPGLELLGVAVAELAVLGGLGHVEVDVARRGVGEPLVDQPLRDRDDLGDVLGGPGHVVDPVDPERLEAVEVVAVTRSASSLTVVPSFWAWTISLSSTSVMLTTQVTS